MTISILGIGVISPLGFGCDSLEKGLMGRIYPEIEIQRIETKGDEYLLPAYVCRLEKPGRYIEKRVWRRINYLIRMAMVASFQAIEDSGIRIEEPARIGIVFGTGYGMANDAYRFSMSCFEREGIPLSPTTFVNSVHNSIASYVSIATGFRGPCQTFSNLEQTIVPVLLTAEDWLSNDIVDYVLVGVGEECSFYRSYCTLSITDERLAVPSDIDLKETLPVQPFNFKRCSYVPGEGYIAFVMGKKRDYDNNGYADISFHFEDMTEPVKNTCQFCIYSKRERRDPGLHARDAMRSFRAIFFNMNSRHLIEEIFVTPKNENGTAPLTSGPKLASYSSLYGCMPSDTGFDLAIAALSTKMRMLFPSPETTGGDSLPLIRYLEPLKEDESICIPVLQDNGQLFVIGVS